MRKRVTKIAAIALFGALPLAAIADDGHRGRGYGGTGYWDHGRDYRHPAKHHRYYGPPRVTYHYYEPRVVVRPPVVYAPPPPPVVVYPAPFPRVNHVDVRFRIFF
jgi:hypothetical protein